MKILLLEDDYSLHIAIKESIQLAGHSVHGFYDGLLAYEAVCDDYRLFILDINVPNLDGLELLKHIKKVNPSASVIMVSANSDMAILEKAYENNCDDYLRKPFNIAELLLKIKRLDKNTLIHKTEHYTYDVDHKKLIVNGAEVPLTNKESKLLYFLIINKNTIVSKEQIVDYVYDTITPLDSTLRSLLRRVRQKIPEDCIETVPSIGYRLNY